MRRLIDADKITYTPSVPTAVISRIVNAGREEDALRLVHVSRAEIDAQPTIDAVPISFIEKKIESIRQYLSEHEGEEFMSGLISKAIAYEKLIEEWREKNGTETN